MIYSDAGPTFCVETVMGFSFSSRQFTVCLWTLLFSFVACPCNWKISDFGGILCYRGRKNVHIICAQDPVNMELPANFIIHSLLHCCLIQVLQYMQWQNCLCHLHQGHHIQQDLLHGPYRKLLMSLVLSYKDLQHIYLSSIHINKARLQSSQAGALTM